MCSFADRMPNDFTAAKNEKRKRKEDKRMKRNRKQQNAQYKGCVKGPTHSKGPHKL